MNNQYVGCPCETSWHQPDCPYHEPSGDIFVDSGGTFTFGRQGWTCPKCGTVWSPDVERCRDCAPDNRTFKGFKSWDTP